MVTLQLAKLAAQASATYRPASTTKADGEGFDGHSLTDCSPNTLLQSQKQGEAESEAVCLDSELKAVVDAWPKLPEMVKAGILAMIFVAK